ncbi:MAG: ArsR/SmtB family transcription factor [Acidimicrobiales bacterium]
MSTAVSVEDADHLARVMGAMATGSRIRILACLRAQSCTVGELTSSLELEQPAVSHQLRILRDLGLVVGTRTGRNVIYSLYDTHIAALVDEALRHIEHLAAHAPDLPDRPRPTDDMHP